MLNLTDPALAPLVARYRAWVAAENKEREKRWEDACCDARREYDAAMKEYEAAGPSASWLSFPLSSHYSAGFFFPDKPTYQGFLDWCIREGIEVPKGGV